ncbi:MAG: phytanoyl-CoA dioxygenase family protein [Flavobacteriales bacterium]|nr:phytanoyl-CoA dioxygenase family protein [Flavobacteriales bacterium]
MVLKETFKRLISDNKHSSESLNIEDKRILAKLNSDGLVVIENYYSKEKCDQIMSFIDTLIQNHDEYLIKDELESDLRLFGADKLNPIVNEYKNDPFIKRIGEAVLNGGAKSHYVLAQKTKFIDGNLGSGAGWHRDLYEKNMFKSILYLSDVDNETGPFQYVSGTHKLSSVFQGIIKFNQKLSCRLENEEIERYYKLPQNKLETIQGKAGTLILANTTAIHRGKPLNKGLRYSITNYFFYDYDKETSDQNYGERVLIP